MQYSILKESENNCLQIGLSTEENVILYFIIEMFQKYISNMDKNNYISLKEMLSGMKKRRYLQNQNHQKKRKKLH